MNAGSRFLDGFVWGAGFYCGVFLGHLILKALGFSGVCG